ncbi:hypothetical protein [Clostridium phage vB_CpeP_PMQ04]|nr:hypothetical protein [Clostridium phage vB_CpeP_PMQ04]
MNNNMMQMFMNMMQSGNPQQLMNMFGNNPMMGQAKKMLEGKNTQQIQETIMNIAKQKGMSEDQVRQMAQQFGIKF